MAPVRRTGKVSVPAAAPAPAPVAPPEPEEITNTGWAAKTSTRGTPAGGDELISSTARAAASLAPALGKISAAPTIAALGDGTATIDVPMKAGDYKIKGMSFTVKPGTVAHVQVQVKNGELVPVHGKSAEGTKLKFDPPLDLPLWVTGQGVQLEGDAAKQKIGVELGGFFDFHFKTKKLSELAAGGDARKPPGAASAPSSSGPSSLSPFGGDQISDLMGRMVDFNGIKVDAKVTMRQADVDIGGAKVKVDPTTTFSLKGDGQNATLTGHVKLDGFGLNQGGVALSGSGGQADLTTRLTRGPDGFAIDSHLSNVNLSLEKLTSAHPSSVVPGKVDQVDLGHTDVTGGDLRLKTRVGLDGLKFKGVSEDLVSFKLKGSGQINSANLTVKDAKDSASLALSGHFEGSLESGASGLKVDAKLTGAHVDVGDLQESMKGNQVSIEHARADGDLQVSSDPAHGKLSIDGEARNLDILVDDFKGGAAGVKADLGRTSVTGNGQFHVGGDGVRAQGRLHGDAVIDAATFSGPKNTAAKLGHSTVSGDLTNLNLGQGAPDLRLENVKADVDVKRAAMDVGQASVTGGGHLKGQGTVVLDANGFSLEGKSQVSMQLDDGRLHSSSVDLKLTKGSGAELNINQLQLGKTSKVKLGPGSKLDAVLDGGSITAGGQTVQLEKGGRARFDVKSAGVVDGKVDVRGSLHLDATVKEKGTDLAKIPGLKGAVQPGDIEGRVKVSVDDAHLADDRLTFSNAQLSVDAKVGKLIGASVPGHGSFGSMQEPPAVLTPAQVKAQSPAQIGGATATTPPVGQPIDALRLLKSGELRVEVPLTGGIHELGVDLVKFPPGSKLDLALSVKDGKVVAKDTRATLSGHARALGVEVLGVHLDDKLKLHADLKVAGRTITVPVPGVTVPADMGKLADLATRSQTAPDPSKPAAKKKPDGTPKGPLDPTRYLDLAHAQLDLTNATFGKGRVSLPGGNLDLTEGSKLSFHGTPLSGELTGQVGFDGLEIGRDNIAAKSSGGGGKADLRLTYRRTGNKTVIDSSLTNVAMNTDYIVRKGENGDYVSLGKGRVTGASISMGASVEVDADGLPKTDGQAGLDDIRLNVPTFTGDLKGVRMTTNGAKGPVTFEIGPSHVDAAIGWARGEGVKLKATMDTMDAGMSGLSFAPAGRVIEVESARVRGTGASVDMAPGRVAVDGKRLEWDATVRQTTVRAGAPMADLKPGKVHITGQGHIGYDPANGLKVDGELHVDGRLDGGASLPSTARTVSVNHKTGVAVGG